MRGEHEFSQTPPPSDLRQNVQQCSEEITRVSETLEQTRSELRHARSEITQYQDEQESHARRTKILWVIAVLLVGTVAGLFWVGAPALRQQQAMITQLPVLRTAFEGLGTRLSSTEGKVTEGTNDRAAMSDRMDKMDTSISSNLATARNDIRAMGRTLKNEWGQSLQAIRSRLSGVESIQREAHDEISKLQNQLATVQTEVTGLRAENAHQAQQIAQQIQQVQESAKNDLQSVDRRVVSHQNRLDVLSNQVDRQRIDFDQQKGRTEQVAPNVFLTVKQTDVQTQRVQGWLQIASDGRIVWLRNESAQHPFDFASQHDERSYQLVFTKVTKTGAAGYVLVPKAQTSTPIAER